MQLLYPAGPHCGTVAASVSLTGSKPWALVSSQTSVGNHTRRALDRSSQVFDSLSEISRTGLLLGRVLDEIDASLNVGLETLDGLVEQLLLVVVDVREDVDDFLHTVGLRTDQHMLDTTTERANLRRTRPEPRSSQRQ
jgi:hypothetical protein